MNEKINLEESITLWIKSIENKVALPKIDLLIFLYNIRESKKYKNFIVSKIRKDADLKTLYKNAVKFLEKTNLIKNTKYDYIILLNRDYKTSLELVCSFYSHGYISYLSAMEYYNLIPSIHKSIDFVVPTRAEWKVLEADRISKILLETENTDFFYAGISYPSTKNRFDKKKVVAYSRKNLFPYIENSDSVRVIEIGCLFLEMIRSPENCGGFDNVLGTFINFGARYYKDIIHATNNYGTKLDKSKIGFLLEEFLGLKDEEFSNWKEASVMRGGSRKIISNAPYSNNYSESWCISLNHSSFSK